LQVKWQAEREQNPAFTAEDHIDLRDRPRIQFRSADLTDKVEHILPHAAALVVFNLIFLSVAFLNFQRYDVR
jgi:hypothetical protein